MQCTVHCNNVELYCVIHYEYFFHFYLKTAIYDADCITNKQQ